MKSENFTITIVEHPDTRQHGGYKYLINAWGSAFNIAAFKTDTGYKHWLERSNLKVEHLEDKRDTKYGLIQIFHASGTIEEKLFQNLSEIPNGAVKYKGLSNGSLVDCYYLKTETGSIEFHPNPNAKEVYKPLSLEESIAHHAVRG